MVEALHAENSSEYMMSMLTVANVTRTLKLCTLDSICTAVWLSLDKSSANWLHRQ